MPGCVTVELHIAVLQLHQTVTYLHLLPESAEQLLTQPTHLPAAVLGRVLLHLCCKRYPEPTLSHHSPVRNPSKISEGLVNFSVMPCVHPHPSIFCEVLVLHRVVGVSEATGATQGITQHALGGNNPACPW